MKQIFSLDELYRNIIQAMSKGVSSYEELTRRFDVTRSTIHRRIAGLERAKIITQTISKMREIPEKLNVISFEFCVGFSWEKLDLSPF